MSERPTAQRGFTLIELATFGAALGLFCLVAFFFTRPQQHTAANNNAERWAGTSQLIQALNHYVADNGSLPKSITQTRVIIGNQDNMADLCSALVPKYLKDVPLDPVDGTENTTTDCTEDATPYVTGYTVQIDKDGFVVITAPSAELGEHISVKRKY